MHRPEVNLFQHPTTTIYVDDSTAFLYSITLAVDLPPFRSFSDPFAALAFIEEFKQQYEFSSLEEAHALAHDQSSKLSASYHQLVSKKLADKMRFAEPSVLVVDYSMPQLNGLDLCSRITNPYIKKVLLTGVADEKIAIRALNTELIDFYISKSESNLSQELSRVINLLRDRYFKDIFGWTRDARLKSFTAYLYNNDFADYFEDVYERLCIVEHYPTESPWGFLLVSDAGKTYQFCIESTENADKEVPRALQVKPDISVEPALIKNGKSPNGYHCYVQQFEGDVDSLKKGSFTNYLQKSELTMPFNRSR